MLHSVTLTTPDNVGRVLRLTHGAQKRIADKVGAPEIATDKSMVGLYNIKFVSNNLVELAYCLAYDQDGKPPADLSLDQMREMYEPDDPELFGAVCEALSKGKKKRQEATQALLQMEKVLEQIQQGTGNAPGPSLVSASVSTARPRRAKSSLANSGT